MMKLYDTDIIREGDEIQCNCGLCKNWNKVDGNRIGKKVSMYANANFRRPSNSHCIINIQYLRNLLSVEEYLKIMDVSALKCPHGEDHKIEILSTCLYKILPPYLAKRIHDKCMETGNYVAATNQKHDAPACNIAYDPLILFDCNWIRKNVSRSVSQVSATLAFDKSQNSNTYLLKKSDWISILGKEKFDWIVANHYFTGGTVGEDANPCNIADDPLIELDVNLIKESKITRSPEQIVKMIIQSSNVNTKTGIYTIKRSILVSIFGEEKAHQIIMNCEKVLTVESHWSYKDLQQGESIRFVRRDYCVEIIVSNGGKSICSAVHKRMERSYLKKQIDKMLNQVRRHS